MIYYNPPQLNRIGIKTQSFRRIVEPCIWNFLVKNNEDGDNDNDDDDSSDDDDKKNNNIDSDVACLSSKKRKYCPAVVSSATDKSCCGNVSMDKQYPYLSRALGGEVGFDPTNPSVKRSMCGLMKELNELLSTEYQLDVNGISNNKISYGISYGRVPWTQSDCSFLSSHKWVKTAIQISGSKRGDMFESAKHITNHIRPITQAGCCIASCHAAVSSSCRPITAPPSRRLIAQAGC